MKVIKTLFPDKPLERRKKRSRQILSQNNSAQIQGMKKQNHEIFGVFQNLEMKILKIYFISKFFFFLKIYLERKIYPDFGKTQKFHDFVFSSPEFGQKSFPAGKDFDKIPFHSPISRFLCLKTLFSSYKFHHFFGNLQDKCRF